MCNFVMVFSKKCMLVMSVHKPVVCVEAQGRLLRVRATLEEDDRPRGGGVRGGVTEFTPQSRLRLFRMLARLKAPESKGYRSRVSFLTLTTKEILHPKVFKVLLFRFLRILKRRTVTTCVIWRLEYQKRGAPHVHCILYDVGFLKKEWIQEQWGNIVGEAQPFTRIELVRAYKQLMSYAAKYVGKVGYGCGFNSVTYSDRCEGLTHIQLETAGRVWGVFNRDCLPYDRLEQASIPQDGAWYMIRAYCRRFYDYLEPEEVTGFTVFHDDPYHALRHIVHLSDTFGVAYKSV